MKVTNVLELLNESVRNEKFSTGSKSLDLLLGGGVDAGRITEVYGEAGSGKTQLILNLAVNVAADNFEAVILDTEGKICGKRIKEIVTSRGLQGDVLNRILIRQCRSQTDLLATVQLLKTLINAKPRVKGVFIDSIAHPFRYYLAESEDVYKNPGLLYRICEILNDVAYSNNLPIVVTNQVTTSMNDEDSQFIPALGEAWRHAVPTRLKLKHIPIKEKDEDFEPGLREAILEKSSNRERGTAKFIITSSGISDPDTNNGVKKKQSQNL